MSLFSKLGFIQKPARYDKFMKIYYQFCASRTSQYSSKYERPSSGQSVDRGSAQARVDELKSMRSRMRKLHRLDKVYPLEGSASKLSMADEAEFNEADSYFTGLVFAENRQSNDHTVNDKKIDGQMEFIQTMKQQGQIQRKDKDAYVQTCFGLVRMDSKNKLKGKKNQDTFKMTVENPDHLSDDGKFNIANYISEKDWKTVDEYVEDATVETFESQPSVDIDENLFDEQYFVNAFVNGSTDSIPNQYEKEQIKTPNQHHQRTTVDVNNFFDEQYLGMTKTKVSSTPAASPGENSIIEDQFFGNIDRSNISKTSVDDSLTKDRSEKVVRKKQSTDDKNPRSSNFIEEQYFSKNVDGNEDLMAISSSYSEEFLIKENVDSNEQDILVEEDLSKNEPQEFETEKTSSRKIQQTKKASLGVSSASNFNEMKDNSTSNRLKDGVQKKELTNVRKERSRVDLETNTIYHDAVTRREAKSHSRPIANLENPETAYDVAMKIRLEKKKTPEITKQTSNNSTSEPVLHPRDVKWTGKVDSKGFKILDNQVVDLQRLTTDDLVSVLKDSILYEDDQLLVIDKPYGLPAHGGPGVHNSVGKVLDLLAARVDKSGRLSTLHMVHRLDKETTGVMVLAKNQQVADILLSMFKKRQVLKRYWVITKGIPDPLEGVIDIPIAEGTVGDRYRMTLKPNYSRDMKFMYKMSSEGERQEAITNYKVLSSCSSAALVECQPETGVKHQIRCHLAFGLNTPILGDHKYSHYSKMAPQKLHPEMLQRLGIRQAKARHLPMHLHAHSIVLPEFRDGRNLFISARLPPHFVQNMKWLKLKFT